jgi:hypothetical protein
MKRHIGVAIFALAAITPLIAQAPQGWKMRVDRSASASDPDGSGAIKFVTMGAGFHATNPQAAVYWNPANTASVYAQRYFTLMEPSGHANYGSSKKIVGDLGSGSFPERLRGRTSISILL